MKDNNFDTIIHETGVVPLLPVAFIPSRILRKSLFITHADNTLEAKPLTVLDRLILKFLGEKYCVSPLESLEENLDHYPLTLSHKGALCFLGSRSPFHNLLQLCLKLRILPVDLQEKFLSINSKEFDEYFKNWIMLIAKELVYAGANPLKIKLFQLRPALKRGSSQEIEKIFFQIFTYLGSFFQNSSNTSLRTALSFSFVCDAYEYISLNHSVFMMINLLGGCDQLSPKFYEQLKLIYLKLGGRFHHAKLCDFCLPDKNHSLVTQSSWGRLHFRRFYSHYQDYPVKSFSKNIFYYSVNFKNSHYQLEKQWFLHLKDQFYSHQYSPHVFFHCHNNDVTLKVPLYQENVTSSYFFKDCLLKELMQLLQRYYPKGEWSYQSHSLKGGFTYYLERPPSLKPSVIFQKIGKDMFQLGLNRSCGFQLWGYLLMLERYYLKLARLF